MTAPVEVPALEEVVPRIRHSTGRRSESWLLRLVGPGSWAIWANLVCVLGVIVVTLSQLHPSLLFAQTTTAGGDTGAHVALPAFLKNDLLPEGRLTGWDPDGTTASRSTPSTSRSPASSSSCSTPSSPTTSPSSS